MSYDKYRNMISFAIMAGLLVVMVCVVHYDLFGLFPSYPYRRRTYTVNKQQQQQPTVMEFDHMWIPRPGTDTKSNTYFSYPTILVDDYDDYDDDDDDDDDDYWSEVRNADDEEDTNGNNCGTVSSHRPTDPGTCSVTADHGDFDQKPKCAPFSDHEDEYDNSDDDYTAPGEERDENVF